MMGKKGKIAEQSSSQLEDDFEFSVSLKLNEKQLTIDVDKKLHIPSIDILTPQRACNMMAENPALHARWNVLSNQAAYEADLEKIRFEVWVKERSRTYRSELTETLGKRVTDKQVEEAVLTDPDYLRKYSNYLRKKENAANVKSIALGFGERGERLVNIVSMMKWEKPTSTLKNNGRRNEEEQESERSAFSDDNNDSDE